MESSSGVRVGTALEARIRARWPHLSVREQAVADFLLADPNGFVSLSISAIAARCGVSETVIVRLYRKLGYDGFHEFKIDIARSLTGAPVAAAGDIREGDDPGAVVQKVFAATRQALEDALPAVDPAVLARARDLLLRARRVVVMGFGGSAPVALDLAHKLLKIGIVATPLSDSHVQGMAAAVLGPGDVVVAVSHSGNSRDIVEALESARGRGAATVLLTGFPGSPAARAAELVLLAPCRETQYRTDSMTSRIVQLAVVDALYVALVLADPERARATVHETSRAAARKKL